jgi:hypothetical protein
LFLIARGREPPALVYDWTAMRQRAYALLGGHVPHHASAPGAYAVVTAK